MTALSKRKTRRLASLCSSMSKAPREWLPTKSWFSTSAKTKPPAIFPLQKTWERALLHKRLRQRHQLRPNPSLSSADLRQKSQALFRVLETSCGTGLLSFPSPFYDAKSNHAFSLSLPRPLFYRLRFLAASVRPSSTTGPVASRHSHQR